MRRNVVSVPQPPFSRSHFASTATWIEGWYEPRRRHSGIGQKSPINFEKQLHDKANAALTDLAELTSAGELKI
jgi:hypothetical protein